VLSASEGESQLIEARQICICAPPNATFAIFNRA